MATSGSGCRTAGIRPTTSSSPNTPPSIRGDHRQTPPGESSEAASGPPPSFVAVPRVAFLAIELHFDNLADVLHHRILSRYLDELLREFLEVDLTQNDRQIFCVIID